MKRSSNQANRCYAVGFSNFVEFFWGLRVAAPPTRLVLDKEGVRELRRGGATSLVGWVGNHQDMVYSNGAHLLVVGPGCQRATDARANNTRARSKAERYE